jgi:Protein of unknown function (DUF3551)
MMTRSMILFVYVSMISPLLAQNYPYCAQYDGGSSLDCSFSTLSMCNESVSGVGGICTLNPRGPAPSTGGAGALPFNPTYVRPPPIQQQSSSAVTLPSAPGPCNPVINGTYCATAGGATSQSIAPIQSLSSDLAIGTDPPATLGAITFNSNGTNCIALFRRMSCGGP